eukprot:15473811-Alexandrium_andersonii.AAC.1
MFCAGCVISSKALCPIAQRAAKSKKGKASGPVPRVAWGKTTARTVRSKAGERIRKKMRAGEWCRICCNIGRVWAKRPEYKKCGKTKLTFKAIKNDLKTKPEVRDRWRAN